MPGDEEEFICLNRVRDYYRMMRGKRVHVNSFERHDSRLPSDAAAQRTAAWIQSHGQAEFQRNREFQARSVKMNEGSDHHNRDMAQGVPAHIREAAEDMGDSAILAAMHRIDEDDLSPLDRAIMAEFLKRGLVLNPKLTNVSFNVWFTQR